MISTIMKVYPVFGWIGSLLILAGIVPALLVYRGKSGERYELRNHYISELGERGVSRRAVFFNTGMILGGIAFIPMMIGIGLTLNSFWGKAGMITGIIAAVAATFVGVFPMDNLTPHRASAMTFFRTGLLTVVLFTIAIFMQPEDARVIPLVVNILGIITISCYVVFLFIVGKKMDKKGNPNYILDPTAMPQRPHFWRSAFLEWLLFISTILWFLVVAVSRQAGI